MSIFDKDEIKKALRQHHGENILTVISWIGTMAAVAYVLVEESESGPDAAFRTTVATVR